MPADDGAAWPARAAAALDDARRDGVARLAAAGREFMLHSVDDALVVSSSVRVAGAHADEAFLLGCRLGPLSLRHFDAAVLIDRDAGVLKFVQRQVTPDVAPLVAALRRILLQIEVWLRFLEGRRRGDGGMTAGERDRW